MLTHITDGHVAFVFYITGVCNKWTSTIAHMHATSQLFVVSDPLLLAQPM